MVGHDFHIQNFVTVIILLFKNEDFQAGVNAINQNLTPILGAKDDVILATVNKAVGVFVLFAVLSVCTSSILHNH